MLKIILSCVANIRSTHFGVFTNEDVELNLVRPTVKVVHVNDLLEIFKGKSNFKITNNKINSVDEQLSQLK